MFKPQKIGQGTFGCVFKPSIKCKDETINYDDKISKLMIDGDADDEMEKYIEINKIDKQNKYHLPPRTCVPDDSEEIKNYVLECKDGKNIVEKYNDYKLIVMKYGGPDLTHFFKEPMENTPKNKDRINNFWINAVDLFKAVILFLENGLVHHDLKPDNIVYDESIDSLKIIDFGLLQFKTKIIKKSNESRYTYSNFHFNYPPESILYNKKVFETIHPLKDDYDEMHGHEKRTHVFFRDKTEAQYNDSLEVLMRYVGHEELHPQLEEFIVNGFYDFVEEKVSHDEPTYNEFLEKSINTIDTYGLGISLMYVLKQVYKLMETNIVKRLDTLFIDMIHPDIRQRIQLYDALSRYESIIRGFPSRKRIDVDVKIPPIRMEPSQSKDFSFTSSELRELRMTPSPPKEKKGGKYIRWSLSRKKNRIRKKNTIRKKKNTIRKKMI